jgi:hypothetical protein
MSSLVFANEPPKVWNKNTQKVPDGAVYIGRPSKFGNPYVIGEHGTRNEVISRFEKYLLANPELLAAAKKELNGKDLVCFCSPKRCHGDILLRYAHE